ncbi:MATE family efflux transporter [Psychromonas sp. Urea-02u-13]|uniref:MATE family efflux transporter n=1 Tax=Psychromonas sp. Urea-02u-13 TaxID=2058326 RepID=UPI000C33E50F|nr:MATE family efflux transporter [Psychromonas sp. Urea-02u-13]PKG40875.1 MATE family efflux transporter [Psychromonas sp. Urea-02u-13]
MSNTQLTLDTDEIEVASQTSHSHPLLTHAIGGQFLKLAFPIIIALMINGLYSFVDAIFITRGVGINAMASVSAVFPINMLIISISAMLGSGMASIISRHLGSGDKQTANQIFSSSLLFSIAIGFGLSVLLYLIRFQIYQLLALPQELLNDADAYLVPILLITTISFASGTLTESFRAAGKPQDMMKVMLLGSLLNVAFDALFIFAFEWGVPGAAWATVLAMLCSFSLAVRLQMNGKDRLQLTRKAFRFNVNIHKQVVSLGFPVFLSHSGFAFTIAVTIFSVTKYSNADASLLLSAHGLIIRSFMLLFLPLLGMTIALQTLAAYNFGAGQLKRVKQSFFTAIMIGTIWTTCVSLLLVFKPQWLLQLFTEDKLLIETASNISSIVFLGFITTAAGMMCSTIFQAMGKALPAMLLEAARTYILLLPLILSLPAWLGVKGIWWAFPITDVIGVTIALLFTAYYFKNRLEDK